jgi:hypothetical protein
LLEAIQIWTRKTVSCLSLAGFARKQANLADYSVEIEFRLTRTLFRLLKNLAYIRKVQDTEFAAKHVTRNFSSVELKSYVV